mmetsp:Transcript_23879/g.71894  ORF Transcript_23879/g.71894 Transcript_23879/m.71894 type:complete len:254 (-) Transcript_23879:17-778(-)
MEASLELPHPPAWYAQDDLQPPPVPKNKNLRSFGSPDFDEAFWQSERPAEEHAAEIQRLNKAAMLQFCGLLRLGGSGDPDDEPKIEDAKKEMAATFREMHEQVGILRIHEARHDLLRRTEDEARQRREAARMLRDAAADARAKLRAMLDGPDAPLPKVEESEAEIVEKAMRISDEFAAKEASDRAMACLAGNPLPLPEPWASEGVTDPQEDDLKDLVARLEQTCNEAQRQEALRQADKEAKREARRARKAAGS